MLVSGILIDCCGKTEHNLTAIFTQVGDNPTSLFKGQITKNMGYAWFYNS